jgi:hypothetical protein
MQVRTLFIIVGGLFLLTSCQSQPCERLPQRFESYDLAINLVKSSTFSLKDKANTTGSSWIKYATYFSCDGTTGYLIYKPVNGSEYIHSKVPVNIWEGFKNANSKGEYYNSRIKGRYRLELN